MFAFGFLGLTVGLYLMNSAIKGRPPIETLMQMLREPGNVRGVLDRNNGAIVPLIEKAIEDSMSESSYEGLDSTVDDSASSGGSAGSAATGDVAKVIAYAKAQLGKPYRWGGSGPDAFDCTGLTQNAYAKIGIKLGRTTYVQVTQGRAVSKANLQPGDLVFPTPGHVQMYLGGGKIIEAPRTGLNVRISTLGRVWKARRYVKG